MGFNSGFKGLSVAWKDIRLPKYRCYVAQLSLDWKNRQFPLALMKDLPTAHFIRNLTSATGNFRVEVPGT